MSSLVEVKNTFLHMAKLQRLRENRMTACHH